MLNNITWKGLTFQSDALRGTKNHDRHLELQAEIKADLPQIKKHRNRRRNLRKQMREAW